MNNPEAAVVNVKANTGVAAAAAGAAAAAFTAATAPLIERVSIKIPEVWITNIDLWFHQVEAQFANLQVVNSLTKFNYIVGAFLQHMSRHVRELIERPPAQDQYNVLKTSLIKKLGLTEAQLPASLYEWPTPGRLEDFRPSQHSPGTEWQQQ
jgi:hypothetical protein